MLNNMPGLLQALLHKTGDLGIILNKQDLHGRLTPETDQTPRRRNATPLRWIIQSKPSAGARPTPHLHGNLHHAPFPHQGKPRILPRRDGGNAAHQFAIIADARTIQCGNHIPLA